MSYREVLGVAQEIAVDYLEGLDRRPVAARCVEAIRVALAIA